LREAVAVGLEDIEARCHRCYRAWWHSARHLCIACGAVWKARATLPDSSGSWGLPHRSTAHPARQHGSGATYRV